MFSYKKLLAVNTMLMSFWVGELVSEELPDPTKPLDFRVEEVVQSTLTLHSILWSTERKVAIINDKQLTEKQWIGNKQVTKILSDQVWLDHLGNKIVLRLHNSEVRR